MKRFFTIISLVLLVAISSMNATVLRRGRKSLMEIAPKASFFFGSDVEMDFGADIIINPTRNLGFRFSVVDIHTNGGTTFFLNYNLLYPTLDALFYFQRQAMNPYAHVGLGFISHSGSILTLKGGAGFDFYMDADKSFFVEPGLMIMHFLNHDSDTDIYFFISGGMKFGIFK